MEPKMFILVLVVGTPLKGTHNFGTFLNAPGSFGLDDAREHFRTLRGRDFGGEGWRNEGCLFEGST